MVSRLIIFISLLISLPLVAAELVIPNTFTANTPARAEEVNQNFTAVQSTVNANNNSINSVVNELDAVQTRVSNNEDSIESLDARLMIMEDTTTRSLVFPAGALSFSPSGPLSLHENGLQFPVITQQASNLSEGRIFLAQPADYAGGSVRVRLVVIGGAGDANGKTFSFFLRVGSFDPSEGIFRPTAYKALATPFADTCEDFGCFAQPVYTINALSLTKKLWVLTLTREQGSATDEAFEELYVASLTLDYQALK